MVSAAQPRCTICACQFVNGPMSTRLSVGVGLRRATSLDAVQLPAGLASQDLFRPSILGALQGRRRGVHPTLTEETRHLVNREVLGALGRDGVLINVGRGGLVDEPELVRCLREGVIGGTGLDVYENEPNVPSHAMLMHVYENHRAVLTPESKNWMWENICVHKNSSL
ncbi:uncharacterized protein LOC133910649 [Phragmites australis]|uniref:uncharacterized protein LOC133910649 n=1 Tax=Phragmites australis TaxID=29695 RepID=UPI002D78334F|nr:uncharacterized protein LOC133910649 [Phragmites australis]